MARKSSRAEFYGKGLSAVIAYLRDLNLLDDEIDTQYDIIEEAEKEQKRIAELEALARGLVCNLPPCEIDLAHVVWGNTNAYIVMEARGALARALGVRHVWPEEGA